jgi:hypothetical protein
VVHVIQTIPIESTVTGVTFSTGEDIAREVKTTVENFSAKCRR